MIAGVATLPLAAQGEHEHRVDLGDVAVQRNIAPCATADYKLSHDYKLALALVPAYRSSDHGVLFEYRDRLNDLPDSRRGVVSLVLREMIQDALEVVSDFRREFDPRHPQRTSFLARGRTAAFPAMRASR